MGVQNKRLTNKDIIYITSGANVVQIPDIVEDYKYTGQAIIKLGQLEDIEEELGIDLITLFKALKNGMYYKNIFNRNDRNVIHFVENYRLSFSYNETDYSLEYDNYNCICAFSFKDYGKTWALTKEELEK